jgi:hypothetical protein
MTFGSRLKMSENEAEKCPKTKLKMSESEAENDSLIK